MADNYITKEITTIMQKEQYPYPKNVAMSCAWIMANLKGINLKVFDLEGKSSLADNFVLASAENPTQAQAMADQIIRHIGKNHKIKVKSVEGLEEANWILLDLQDTIVHIFLESTRSLYDLDKLWKESPQIEIPNEYYYSASKTETSSEEKSNEDDLKYF